MRMSALALRALIAFERRAQRAANTLISLISRSLVLSLEMIQRS